MNKLFRVALPDGSYYDASENETLLASAQRAHWLVRYGCRNGNCEACTGNLLSGSVQHRDGHIIEAPAQNILLCLCRPLDDLRIELPSDPRAGSFDQSLRVYTRLHRQQISGTESILHFILPAGRKPALLGNQIALIETDDGLLQGLIDQQRSHGRELVIKLIFTSPLREGAYYHMRYPLSGNRENGPAPVHAKEHRDD